MAASATGSAASIGATTEFVKGLESTHRSLREQEQLACSLAKTLAKLCAETEEHLTMCGVLQPTMGESVTSNEGRSECSRPMSKKEPPNDRLSNSNAANGISFDNPEEEQPRKNQLFDPILPGTNATEVEGSDGENSSPGFPKPVQSPIGGVYRNLWHGRSGKLLMRKEPVMQLHLNDLNESADMIAVGDAGGRCVFANPEELKAEIRKKLVEEPYEPCKLFKQTGLAQAIARTTAFEVASMMLLVASSVWIAVAMDHNDSVVLHKSPVFFQVITHFFCLCFLVEVMVRICAFRLIRYAVRDFWCCFDTLLVVLFICETWILGTMSAISGIEFTGRGLNTVVAFRVLRLMRLMRVLRLVRLLHHVPQLMVIIRGLGMALRSVACVLALLLLFIYAGGIVGRGLFEGSAFGNEWFPTVLVSMGTLMLECTLSGSRGTALIREAHAEHPAYALLLLLFVLLANVTMMGILAGILVQTVRTVAEVEREEKSVRDLVKTMESLWNMVSQNDQDQDGKISWDEFAKMITGRDTARIMRAMDVDVEGLLNVASFVFDQYHGRMGREEFLQMVLDLRGNKKATVKDHMETRKFIHSQIQHLGRNST